MLLMALATATACSGEVYVEDDGLGDSPADDASDPGDQAGDSAGNTAPGGSDDLDDSSLAEVDVEGPAVLAHVQRFANRACAAVDSCKPSTYSGHSPVANRALDNLVSDVYGKTPTDNNALGDTLAEYALDHKAENGIDYVIWRQRINFGDGNGWKAMENRGGITQNHYDHVHISFETTAP